jgi:hypothetical protein
MKLSRFLLLPLFTFLLCLPSFSAKNHERDPLTDEETNQLREESDTPPRKIALYVKFINQRVQNIDHLRADTHLGQERGSRIHEALEDFVSLSDELGDNIDDAASKYVDIRKILSDAINANTEWQRKLEALKTGAPSAEMKEYEFVLTDALEAAQTSGASYTAVLEKQNIDIPRLQKEAKEREKRRRERE